MIKEKIERIKRHFHERNPRRLLFCLAMRMKHKKWMMRKGNSRKRIEVVDSHASPRLILCRKAGVQQ
jgi:hypothetical protein